MDTVVIYSDGWSSGLQNSQVNVETWILSEGKE